MILQLKKFGPGFLFAGAAIGVSHLVQSTRAGADFGFGLLWALLLINFIKYPFFEFGPRYASATGENLLQGYRKMGKGVLIAYFVITLCTMFTIQTAVTIVTAGIASYLFGNGSIVMWTAIITIICLLVLVVGRFKFLDRVMKVIVISLTLSTLVAVILAIRPESNVTFAQVVPRDAVSVAFLIAFMGWMPAPLDISIWQSIWTLEKKKLDPEITPKQSRFDFNIGFFITLLLAIGFVGLGALVMFGNGEVFSANGTQFANQLISMYTVSLGESSKIIIAIAALTTMFSTSLTTLDASPRVMNSTSEIILEKNFSRGYHFWLIILVVGTLAIFFFFNSEMGLLIKIATILSFLTAPFYAIANYKLLTGKHTPIEAQPSKMMKIYSLLCIVILFAFSFWYLSTLF